MITAVEIDQEAKVPGVGKIRSIEGVSYDLGLIALRCVNARLASCYDIAKARVALGVDNTLSTSGSFTREGWVYRPGHNPLLVRDSPLRYITVAQEGTKAHNNDQEYMPSSPELSFDHFLTMAREDSSKPPFERRVIEVIDTKNSPTDTREPEAHEAVQFLLGDATKPYCDLLNNHAIRFLYLSPMHRKDVALKEGTFVRPMWFSSCLGPYPSHLRGYGKALNYTHKVRGVAPLTLLSLIGARVGKDHRRNFAATNEFYSSLQLSAAQERKGARTALDLFPD